MHLSISGSNSPVEINVKMVEFVEGVSLMIHCLGKAGNVPGARERRQAISQTLTNSEY
jgi:hypothetical protein